MAAPSSAPVVVAAAAAAAAPAVIAHGAKSLPKNFEGFAVPRVGVQKGVAVYVNNT